MPAMLQDLAALTPPLVVCGAFLAGLVIFLRRQMGPRNRADDVDGGPDISAEARNDDAGDAARSPSPGSRRRQS